MFNKLIPNSVVVGALTQRDPRRVHDPKKAAIAALPPSFRKARHAVADASDPKRPPTFTTTYEETETRPGATIHASDTVYVVAEDGSLRHPRSKNLTINMPPATDPQSRAKARSRERLERQLAQRERRRAARAVAAARHTQERARRLQQQVRAERRDG